MAIEIEAVRTSEQDRGQAAATDYPKVESFAADVQHHRPGEPVGSIPLSVPEAEIPHHAGANPTAGEQGS